MSGFLRKNVYVGSDFSNMALHHRILTVSSPVSEEDLRMDHNSNKSQNKSLEFKPVVCCKYLGNYTQETYLSQRNCGLFS